MTVFSKAIQRTRDLSPLSAAAVLIGFRAAIDELEYPIHPEVEAFIVRAESIAVDYVSRLDDAGLA